jgi:hypothetical protein
LLYGLAKTSNSTRAKTRYGHSLGARLNSAPRLHVNIHLIADAQEKNAGVLHAPLNIRDDEVSCNVEPVARGNSLDHHRHLVVLAMNPKRAMDARFRQCTLHVVRGKDDFRIPIAFENVVMHFLVTRLAAAIAALGVNNDLSGAFTGREIIVHGSTLQLERALNGVKNVTQRELDVRLGRVQFEDRLLSK